MKNLTRETVRGGLRERWAEEKTQSQELGGGFRRLIEGEAMFLISAHLSWKNWMKARNLTFLMVHGLKDLLFQSPTDRYRQDFSKAGPWPFITRLARNTISPIINHPKPFPALPPLATSREKGKQVIQDNSSHSASTKPTYFQSFLAESSSKAGTSSIVNLDKHCDDKPIICSTTPASLSPSTTVKAVKNIHQGNINKSASVSVATSIMLSVATPPAYVHVPPQNSSRPFSQDSTPVATNSTLVTSIPLDFSVATISTATTTSPTFTHMRIECHLFSLTGSMFPLVVMCVLC
ncbi:hypothetical protein G4B88_023952 [Cannabis sativa]|uniref:Uncharacterized protein n=1 Tax=Cannabis sativa TaxID=3483 RepID=A0A7J6GKN7_CANSA|nr:hypothetical protein G4B88_023952 [Cannabis sativa]